MKHIDVNAICIFINFFYKISKSSIVNSVPNNFFLNSVHIHFLKLRFISNILITLQILNSHQISIKFF